MAIETVPINGAAQVKFTMYAVWIIVAVYLGYVGPDCGVCERGFRQGIEVLRA